jgi:hypothetical protein
MALGFVIFLIICVAVYLRLRHPKPSLGIAYAGDRGITLYDSSAQVRSPVGSVDYGELLQIEQRFGEQVEVRTPSGLIGWTDNDDLISPELWQQEKDLDAKTAATTPESQGHTGVISNLHLEPGRDTPRIRQLKKDISVELFERRPMLVPVNNPSAAPTPQPESDTDSNSSLPSANEPKKEDWWLVRAHLNDKNYVSGWMLGRFVDLDVPAPLPDYASTAGMRIVAWFTLNPALDDDGQKKDQYLLVGGSGPEGQACDFTMMRVYTWAKTKGQYETAFVANDLCGRLPVTISRMPAAQTATIAFIDPSDGSPQTYHMVQTIVRRVKDKADDGGNVAKKKAHR